MALVSVRTERDSFHFWRDVSSELIEEEDWEKRLELLGSLSLRHGRTLERPVRKLKIPEKF